MMSSSTTFRVSKKTPTREIKFNENNTPKNFHENIKHLPHYTRNHCTEVLKGTPFPNNYQLPLYQNGLVGTVTQCYNGHHNLILRPDDIWTAIMTQFSFYTNKEAEKFRGKFVNFEGKKELEVKVPGRLRNAPYELLVKLMSKKIDENLVDPEVKSWILPSFSTTTDNDLVTCGVVFMATMKKYFDYKFCLMCGIPYVTLEGSLEDWQAISQRLEKLKEYELNEWYQMLKPILEQFIQAKNGKPDVEFWDRICSNHGGGSGPRYLSGWITAFCVFDKDGNWRGGNKRQQLPFGGEVESEWTVIDTNDIPPGIVEVDVKIDDNGTLYYSSMFAGHLGIEWSDDRMSLKPSPGWVICLKPDPEEIERLDKEREDNRRFKK